MTSPGPDPKSMTGLEQLRGMASGAIPDAGINETLRLALVEIELGRAVFEGRPFEGLVNPSGLVHGGWLMTMIDSAAGAAVYSTLETGMMCVTLETKVNFMRGVKLDAGVVRAEGRVIGGGRTIIASEARITDARGTLYAHGTSTLMVTPIK